MPGDMKCPKCGWEFPLEKALMDRVEGELRTRFEESKAEELRKFEEDLSGKHFAELKRLKAEADAKHAAAHAIEEEQRAGLEQELAATREQAGALVAKEGELLRQRRELEEREKRVNLDLETRLADERKQIEARLTEEAKQRFEQERAVELERLAKKTAEERDAQARLAAEETARAERISAAKLAAAEKDAAAERTLLQEQLEKAKAAAASAAKKQQEISEAAAEKEQAAALAVAEKERELAKRERELELQSMQRKAEAEKHLAEEQRKIQAASERASQELLAEVKAQQALREQEHVEKTIQLQKKLDELQQRLSQGSQQQQGDAQEASLREQLVAAFGAEEIVDVPKGKEGADLIQSVRNSDGEECGAIVWESKRTLTWTPGWLPKLRDDQRAAGGVCAVIVSQALPAGVKGFSLIDGVWVCGWGHAVALASVLRVGLIEVFAARRAQEGRGTKMQLLYEYMTGHEFRNRVQGVAEVFTELQSQLDHEKTAFQRIWKHRQKSIWRAKVNLGALYGELQGIAGQQLESIDALALESAARRELPAGGGEELELDDDDTDDPAGNPALAPQALPPVPAELVNKLFALIPADGAAIGNGTLLSLFVAAGRALLQTEPTGAHYEACKIALLAQGKIRKGKGRGGSVARVNGAVTVDGSHAS